MDIYGQDVFGVDEFLDFSGDDDVFSSSADTEVVYNSSTDSGSYYQYSFNDHNNSTSATDFTDHFCVPTEDLAELEWLSNFVDNSSTNFPANNIAGTINFQPQNQSIHSKSRSKRTRTPSHNTTWTSASTLTQISNTNNISESSSSNDTSSESYNNIVRKCTHCASDKTPQWRTGPLGPKTLCNACGVRYKSGRLVPEYRPAASPTFVLTKHSNSHRKVMELRRQKEMSSGHYHHHQYQLQSEHHMYGHHGSNYEVGELAGIAVGSAVCINSILAGPISGGSMNPARTIGPALASNTYKGIWVYIVGPITGTLTGVMCYSFIRAKNEQDQEISSFGFMANSVQLA